MHRRILFGGIAALIGLSGKAKAAIKRNGECPVCSTVSKPAKIVMCEPLALKQTRLVARGVVADSEKVPCQTTDLVRCLNCNNAFFVDAEK